MSYVIKAGKYIVLPLLLVFVGAVAAVQYSKSLNDDGNWFSSERGIDTSEYVTLNGVEQFVRIRSRDKTNPILLNLHGGPGFPQTPYSHRVFRPLTEYFTVVEWDQRGSGRSPVPTKLNATMTYDQMVGDTIELIETLKKQHGQEKVILVGYSWGSMLGLGVIKKRPDLIHAYVGVGQALAWPRGFDETQRLVTEAATKAGDQDTLDRLNKLSKTWPPAEDVDGTLERIGIIQAPMERYGTSLHASKSNSLFKGDIVLDLLSSPDVSVTESISMLNVSDATKALMADIYGTDFPSDPDKKYDVPVFIFQGEHDWQTPTTLVKPWFEKLEAPHKEYVAFDDSAHILISEEPGKFLHELVSKVRPFAKVTAKAGAE